MASETPMLTRSLSASREAYRRNDPHGLVMAHKGHAVYRNAQGAGACDPARLAGRCTQVKPLVYGGLDGTLATFAIVSAVYGGGLHWTVALVMAPASLLAEAISMGVGDYASTRAEQELVRGERKREEWEFDTYPEGEQQEMAELLSQRGVPAPEAKQVISILSRHRGLFIDFMLVQELGLLPEDGGVREAALSAAVTAASFIVFGAAPVCAFCGLQGAAEASGADADALRRPHFLATCLITLCSTSLLGACKAAITGGHVLWGALHMAVIAALAGGASYAASSTIDALMSASVGQPGSLPP